MGFTKRDNSLISQTTLPLSLSRIVLGAMKLQIKIKSVAMKENIALNSINFSFL